MPTPDNRRKARPTDPRPVTLPVRVSNSMYRAIAALAALHHEKAQAVAREVLDRALAEVYAQKITVEEFAERIAEWETDLLDPSSTENLVFPGLTRSPVRFEERLDLRVPPETDELLTAIAARQSDRGWSVPDVVRRLLAREMRVLESSGDLRLIFEAAQAHLDEQVSYLENLLAAPSGRAGDDMPGALGDDPASPRRSSRS